MKIYLAVAAIALLLPLLLLGMAANVLISRVWSWATK
jgi:hypothetical protein